MPLDISDITQLEVNRPGYVPISAAALAGDIIEVFYGQYNDRITFDATTNVCTGQTENDNPTRLRRKSAEVAVKQFKVFFGHKDWGKADWRYLQDDALYLFTDPKLAKAKADELNAESATAESPWKFMVKSETIMSANHCWPEWMQSRVDTGEYVLSPWKDEPWYNKDHFCHASASDPFKVAFIESPVAGVEDRMTVMTPGRYLERFYNAVLTATEIAQWATKADSEAELCFATTPEEIVELYTKSGITSCMHYAADHSNFPLGIQPTSVYAAGDLAFAYLKRRNKIVGRALVWPDKKVVGRIYGDVERLKTRLTAEGYTYKDADASAFHGARLTRIEVEGEIVLPYLDWNMGADEHPTDPNFIIMVDKSKIKRPKWAGQTQNGTGSGASIQICGHQSCRTRIVGGDGLYNSQTGRTMCYPCADAHMVRCIASNSYYDRNGSNYPITQILDRTGTPVTGHRGGWITHYNAADSERYRVIDQQVYLRSETEVVPGRRNTYRPIPSVAVPA